MNPSTRRGGLVANLVLLAAGLVAPAGPAVAAPEPTRILLVGDSVTQGSEGDWTWRYRLWQHLVAVGAATDLVGTETGLHVEGGGTSTTYADPAFDLDHGGHWGTFVGTEAARIRDGLVAELRPDVIVVELGFNDLSIGLHPAVEVADSLEHLVRDAQAADPEVDLVLAELTQTWYEWTGADGGPERRVADLNAELPGLAASLTTATSRVVVADADAGYVEADTYDRTHPTATGEVKIAAAVAGALAELGVGASYAGPWTAPPVPRQPATLAARVGDGSVRLSWTPPPGATAQWIWQRDASAGEAWQRLPYPVPSATRTFDVPGVGGHRYEFRLQSSKGTSTSDLFSPTVSAIPRRAAPGRVRHVVVRRATSGRVALRWRAADRATSYAVRWSLPGRTGTAHRVVVRSARARLAGLTPGRRYLVSVQPRNGRTPGPVTRLRIRAPR